MTKLEFNKFQKDIDANLVSWVKEFFETWDEFVASYLYDQHEFIIPVDCIVPRSLDEWNDAKAYNSYTDALIELELDGEWLQIHDGHNRLKTFIENGVKEIKIKFVK